jgi:hypothetical protein
MSLGTRHAYNKSMTGDDFLSGLNQPDPSTGADEADEEEIHVEKATLHMRVRRAITRDSVTYDLPEWLPGIASQAGTEEKGGHSRAVYILTRLLRSSHDRPMNAIAGENDPDMILVGDTALATPAAAPIRGASPPQKD